MIYFIYGKEEFLFSFYLNKIIEKETGGEKFEVEKIEGDEVKSIDVIFNAIQSQGLFSKKNVIIIKNLLTGNKSRDIKNKVAEKIETVSNGSVVIFIDEGIPDKRENIFKKLTKIASVKEFQKLSYPNILDWLQDRIKDSDINLPQKVSETLIENVGDNLRQLDKELQKLILYAKSQRRKEIEIDDISKLTISFSVPQIFPFIESVANKNLKNSYNYLHQFQKSGESEQYLLSMLIYQFRTLIIISDLLRRGYSATRITNDAKVHPFVLSKSRGIISNFPYRDLISAYFELLRLDESLKTGRIENKIAFDYLIAKIINNA